MVILKKMLNYNPTGIYLLKVNKSTLEQAVKWRQWGHSSVFIVNFEQISHLVS